MTRKLSPLCFNNLLFVIVIMNLGVVQSTHQTLPDPPRPSQPLPGAQSLGMRSPVGMEYSERVPHGEGVLLSQHLKQPLTTPATLTITNNSHFTPPISTPTSIPTPITLTGETQRTTSTPLKVMDKPSARYAPGV